VAAGGIALGEDKLAAYISMKVIRAFISALKASIALLPA
jgi:hypothetical protein